MQHKVHTPWCDRFHVVLGSPECSRHIGETNGLAIMIFGYEGAPTCITIATESGTMIDLDPASASRLATQLRNARRAVTAVIPLPELA